MPGPPSEPGREQSGRWRELSRLAGLGQGVLKPTRGVPAGCGSQLHLSANLQGSEGRDGCVDHQGSGGGMTDQTRELMLERARVIASTLLTISDATGEAVTPDQVQRVALVKLSPVAVRHSVIAANLVLGVIEQLALSHINAQAERPA